ncbi:MAG: four helix bundle protein [Patescibacteria group bacterium]
MRGYKDLKIWQEGIGLVLLCYKITRQFPHSEIYGLASQINRAVVSIPVNIAEGYGRNGNKELIQFLYISLGSCNELDTLLVLAKELGYCSQSQYIELSTKLEQVASQISAFISYRKNK